MEALDWHLLSYVHQHLVSPWLTPFMVEVSAATDWGLLWLVIGAIYVLKGLWTVRTVMWFGLLLGGFGATVEYGIKSLWSRPRPSWMDPSLHTVLAVPHSSSFPSAHAATAAFAALWLGHRPWGNVGVNVAAAAVLISRIYTGLHYPSDVVGGAVLGAVVAVATLRVREHVSHKGAQT